jgi:SHS2 domain-containing protein
MYEVFDHTADIGLRVKAATLDDLFCEAAEALFSLIVTNIKDVEPRQSLRFNLALRDKEYDYLLFDWLNELLFTFDTRRIALAKFGVKIEPPGLEATAWGEPIDPLRHRLEHEVKAITYHGLKLIHEEERWLAEVILDI